MEAIRGSPLESSGRSRHRIDWCQNERGFLAERGTADCFFGHAASGSGQAICMRVASRILFPNTRSTMDDLVATYEQLAPVLLPHLADRPLTLKRSRDGINGGSFWERDAPSNGSRDFLCPANMETGSFSASAFGI
jgi:hypothetical protein